MDLLDKCVRAAVTDDIAAAANAWVAQRLRPLEEEFDPAQGVDPMHPMPVGGRRR
ncbi:hypothetical protein OHA72_52040 [Dactylosporangium sp. NBC_01737]|uniref:hypothetical protein n=1 Tax=Dactylosporangium sp. NBC_01737 TaxID=2975959 RepID=UPI002E1370B2|nr:hypothetical protein OHA72_52040 [Dactylosporangium sp. NBC_01737]